MPEQSQYSMALDEKNAMAGLLAHPGWAKLRSILEEQKRERLGKIICVPNPQDNIDFVRGELASLELALSLPHTVLGNAEATLLALNLEDPNGRSSSLPDDADRFDYDLPDTGIGCAGPAYRNDKPSV